MPMRRVLPRTPPCRRFAGAIMMGALWAASAFFPALAADAPAARAPPATGAPPNLDLSAPGVAWAGFVQPKEPNYRIARLFNDYGDTETGLGPTSTMRSRGR
jgi:hypothetical protein